MGAYTTVERMRHPSPGFAPTLLGNLLPLVGTLAFDWRVTELFVVYWAELWVFLFVYAALAAFARRPVVAADRHLTLPGVSRAAGRKETRWTGDPRTVSLPWLPPVYTRNLPLVGHTLVWGAGLLTVPVLASGYGETLLGAVSLPLALALAGITLSRLLDARTFLGAGRHETMSAHMVLEIPAREVAFAFCYVLFVLAFGTFTFVGVALVLGGSPVGGTVVVTLFVGALVLGRTAIDYSRHRAERADDPSGFAAWFVPEDPDRRGA